jgi:hypothetical protein
VYLRGREGRCRGVRCRGVGIGCGGVRCRGVGIGCGGVRCRGVDARRRGVTCGEGRGRGILEFQGDGQLGAGFSVGQLSVFFGFILGGGLRVAIIGFSKAGFN